MTEEQWVIATITICATVLAAFCWGFSLGKRLAAARISEGIRGIVTHLSQEHLEGFMDAVEASLRGDPPPSRKDP